STARGSKWRASAAPNRAASDGGLSWASKPPAVSSRRRSGERGSWEGTGTVWGPPGCRGRPSKGSNTAARSRRARRNREGAREDAWRAIDAATAVSLPAGREILEVLPQDFVVDEQDGIRAPIGMTGARLEVNVHIITGSQSSTQNIVACVNRAGVNVAKTVVEQLAASDSVLTEDEKELGVALVDIGGG